MEAFDKSLGDLVDSGKLSSSRIKALTDLAMQNIKNDAHLASSLFRTHKRAKPANKLWALYILDAIARECKSVVKRSAKAGDAGSNSPGPAADGTAGGFLAKTETCLERMIDESWERGLPDHREKVKKLVSIWVQASTFAPTVLTRCVARMQAVAASTTPPGSPPRPTLAAASQGPSTSAIAAMPMSAQNALAALLANAGSTSSAPAPVPTIAAAGDPGNPLNALLQQLATQSSNTPPHASGSTASRRDDSPPYQRRSASPPSRRPPVPSPAAAVGGFNALDVGAWQQIGHQAAMYATPPTLDAIHAWAMRGGLAKFNISRDAILAAGQGREAPTPVSSLPLPGANNGFAGGAAMMNSGMGGGDGNAGLAPGMKSRGRMVQGADGRWTFKRE